jgi:hypothetical protein
MAATLQDSYKAMADLNLWFKVQSGDTLLLSDVPSILPLRWTYFKNSWEYIKPDLIAKIPLYENPAFLDQQIKDFSAFLESQRNSSAKVNPFSDAIVLNRYYAVFDSIEITSIQLNNEESRILQATVDRVKYFSKNDFLRIKNALRDYRDRYADTISLADEDYNRAYGRSSIPPQINATITDENYMLNLMQGIKSVDFVLANFFATDAAVDPFALARANANNPEVNIGQYSSGRLVKMEYGEDLQQLAYRYLGDADKWIDIAIANGLKPPYIDEVGERIPLLSNGNGNQINLSGTDVNGNLNIDKLYINQVVFIKSDAEVSVDQRKIANIRQIPVSEEIIVELDGDGDLVKYQIADNAHIRVFKPNTINSSFYVLIPSTDPLPDSRRDETPWFLADASDDEKQQKIDLAVDDSGDLILSPNGDLKFSYGLDNAVQGIKFKIQTEVGSLRYHPNYGIVNILGRTNADVETVKALITDSIVTQIESDPRYERVEGLNVAYSNGGASTVTVSMAVRLAGGGDKVIPISFTVNI